MAIIQGATDTWTKSSYSGGNGACIEVKSPVTHALLVRDSKAPAGPSITFVPDAWSAFVDEAAQGAFDRS
ncbi:MULTISPECIES: DUF397 domain-containing protein [Streptomyces]|uniref:DUF397 domain-containing protein n=1 Tax=Streptomyces chengmaiensis TaxID=3040919 RepID=A0ABT6HL95_9ACTN|nr:MULTISPECIES: DUF397 domain-containing protein [Streptomyces]MDH2389028.1 DUF397 domain-containing protein [Streptomyces chengmaiensis]WRQ82691.1 DUF397 domain-containing protein [Streptomyces sp. MUM 178J]